jgi:hypothetical protein
MRVAHRSAISLASFLTFAMASFAHAQKPPPATGIQDIVVLAPKDLNVVSTYPKEGQSIAGGVMILKIIFDQPMTPEAWSYSPTDKAQFPSCLARPRLLNDNKTFVLLCSLAVETTYGLQINAAPDFVSTAGRAVPAFRLNFTTSSSTPTLNMQDALAAAGLTDADDPIMNETVVAGAVQSSAKHPDAANP